jgi:hypothetical protein
MMALAQKERSTMATAEYSNDIKLKLIDGVLRTLDALEAKGGEPDRWVLRYLAGAVSGMEAGEYANAIRQLSISAKRPDERASEAAKFTSEAEVPQVNTVEALRARLLSVKSALT